MQPYRKLGCISYHSRYKDAGTFHYAHWPFEVPILRILNRPAPAQGVQCKVQLRTNALCRLRRRQIGPQQRSNVLWRRGKQRPQELHAGRLVSLRLCVATPCQFSLQGINLQLLLW